MSAEKERDHTKIVKGHLGCRVQTGLGGREVVGTEAEKGDQKPPYPTWRVTQKNG